MHIYPLAFFPDGRYPPPAIGARFPLRLWERKHPWKILTHYTSFYNLKIIYLCDYELFAAISDVHGQTADAPPAKDSTSGEPSGAAGAAPAAATGRLVAPASGKRRKAARHFGSPAGGAGDIAGLKFRQAEEFLEDFAALQAVEFEQGHCRSFGTAADQPARSRLQGWSAGGVTSGIRRFAGPFASRSPIGHTFSGPQPGWIPKRGSTNRTTTK
jgi:hypothetical protein